MAENPNSVKGSMDDRLVHQILLAHIAQSVERVLGKNEVSGSTPDVGSLIYVCRLRQAVRSMVPIRALLG